VGSVNSATIRPRASAIAAASFVPPRSAEKTIVSFARHCRVRSVRGGGGRGRTPRARDSEDLIMEDDARRTEHQGATDAGLVGEGYWCESPPGRGVSWMQQTRATLSAKNPDALDRGPQNEQFAESTVAMTPRPQEQSARRLVDPRDGNRIDRLRWPRRLSLRINIGTGRPLPVAVRRTNTTLHQLVSRQPCRRGLGFQTDRHQIGR